MEIKFDRDELIAIVQRLIRFKTVVPPGNYEEIIGYIKQLLRNCGFKTQIVRAGKGKANLIALLQGRQKIPGLILHGHVDVVPVAREEISSWISDPFQGKLIEDKIVGRGALDMKGGLATIIMAAMTIQKERLRLRKNLVLTFTGDEEIGSDLTGAGFITKKGFIKGELALVAEPSDLNFALYHKGIAWFNVAVQGKSFHAAYPEKGVNAIYKMLDFVARVRHTRFTTETHPVLGDYTLNLGRIQGGDKVNMIPGSCSAEFDFRLTPGMKARKLEQELRELAERMKRQDPEFDCRIEMVMAKNPVTTSRKLFFLKDLKRIVKEVKGSEPRIIGTISDSDARHFRNIGIPSLWIGPGNLNQGFHGINEYITIDQLVEGCKFFVKAIQNFCGIE